MLLSSYVFNIKQNLGGGTNLSSEKIFKEAIREDLFVVFFCFSEILDRTRHAKQGTCIVNHPVPFRKALITR